MFSPLLALFIINLEMCFLNFEDEYIRSVNYPEKWGVTIIEIKKKTSYDNNSVDWGDVFAKRNHLIGLFWNEQNKKNVQIDLKF